jgi:hypothetical protein
VDFKEAGLIWPAFYFWKPHNRTKENVNGYNFDEFVKSLQFALLVTFDPAIGGTKPSLR